MGMSSFIHKQKLKVQVHQISSTRNVKGKSLCWKERALISNTEIPEIQNLNGKGKYIVNVVVLITYKLSMKVKR